MSYQIQRQIDGFWTDFWFTDDDRLGNYETEEEAEQAIEAIEDQYQNTNFAYEERI